jgi:hypothetical protein
MIWETPELTPSVKYLGYQGGVSRARERISLALFWTSVGLYALCLATDGFYVDGQNPRAWSPGWGELIAGWIPVMEGTLAWLANPLLFLGWGTFRSRQPFVALLSSCAALALMSSFLLVKTVMVSEAPTYARVSGYGAGYWLWMLSALSLIIGCAIRITATSDIEKSD